MLIIVVLSRVTVAVVSPKSFRSSKIMQPVFWCAPIITLISMNCSGYWVGVNSNIKDLNQLLLWCTNLYMGWPLSIWVLDLCFETTKHYIDQGILKINWLFRSPAPIIWRRVSLTAEPGCGTAYLVTFVQQHLYMSLNLTYVTTVLNEF